ncbi:MAG: DUF4404 family protein [Gammaproteobacteria bacterium]|nr:DUF4404 family protein [Gammaproteobacteria bacterium]
MHSDHQSDLREQLRALRAELDRNVAHDNPARPRIERLIRELEEHLSDSENRTSRGDVVGGLRSAIQQFETEHPRATAILNDIMVTLSNMGI